MGKYDDIINLPHHVSTTRSHMSMHDRAAQFSAFAALRGYAEAIEEAKRTTDKWVDLDEYEKYMLDTKLQLIQKHISENPEISITYFEPDSLKEGGAYITVTGKIKKFLRDDFSEGWFSEADIAEDSYEGAIININVNKYERSSIARKKCIEAKGCKCSICGFDFEKVYGDIGKGFIHIHHIVPLNKINKEYKVDYEKDLIPVCPNCHAMLHRRYNGKEISIDELKDFLNR